MTITPEKAQQLAAAIRKLKVEAQQVAALSHELPAAERNCCMILDTIEMLEIEVCDTVDVVTSDSN